MRTTWREKGLVSFVGNIWRPTVFSVWNELEFELGKNIGSFRRICVNFNKKFNNCIKDSASRYFGIIYNIF